MSNCWNGGSKNLYQATDEVDAAFFNRPVDVVARDLIGRTLRVSCAGDGDRHVVIVETEAYGDAADPASHAAFRPGGRAALMAGAPGTVYVYSAYGMYPCLNFVTGPAGIASAVLIRGVWPASESRPVHGPGRTTRLLGVTPDDHGQQIPGPRFGLSTERRSFPIERTTRIGITRGADTQWRFVARTGESRNQP